jgi:hypothetical protein
MQAGKTDAPEQGAAMYVVYRVFPSDWQPPLRNLDAFNTRDADELVAQADRIAAAWKALGTSSKADARFLSDPYWADGADDLARYLGSMPTPPATAALQEGGYTSWIPVGLGALAIVSGPHGLGPPPGALLTGFVARIHPDRPGLCRTLAERGRGGQPVNVSGRGDWDAAAHLEPGDFTCVWNDLGQTGTPKAGDPMFFAYRVF